MLVSAAMGRRPETPGRPADERITVRVNAAMLAAIDQKRGEQPRPAWIRDAIRFYYQKGPA